jgi:mannitol/fructose-specific phosphotransferase system IIA component (Ntr-type)
MAVKIQDVLEKKGILIDLKVKEKNEALSQMGQFLASIYDLQNADFIIQKIFEREAQISTGIGYGIAIPHARLDNIARVFMVAARTAQGIPFGAIDDQPVKVIFMMISPTNTAVQLTGLLSSLSKVMSYEEIRTRLCDAPDPETFLTVLIDGENRYVS